MKTTPISGEVKRNGMVPIALGCPGVAGTVKFTEPSRGDVFEFEINCVTATGPFLFEGALPAGTWEARVLSSAIFPPETFVTAFPNRST